MHLTARFMLAAFLSAVVCACGGPNDGTTTLPQTGGVTSGSDSSTQEVVLGLQPVNATLPTVANITGSVAFPALSAAAIMTLSTSIAAPPGVALQSVHTAQSAGTLTVYEYVSMTPRTTISVPSIPAITLTFPASTPMSGKSFSYGISDPNAQGGSISFDTQGPAQVSGNTVSFAAVPMPLTLQAGHRYTFVVYATTTASAAKIFVANRGNNTVTTYHLDGSQTTPTIHVGVSAPTGVAVDAAGKIYVLNSATNSITTYRADGSPTTPTITKALDGPTAIAVDGSGKVYALNSSNFTVTTYNNDGTQTTPTITGLNQPSAMAVDAAGNVYITNFGFRTFDSGVTTYNPDGSLGSLHIHSADLQPQFIALGATDKIYVDYQFPGILVTYGMDGAPTTPTIATSVPYPFAVDAAGKVYISNSSTDTISAFDTNGVATTPTITAGVDRPSAIIVH